MIINELRTISSEHILLNLATLGRSSMLLRRLTSHVVSTPSWVYSSLARPPCFLTSAEFIQFFTWLFRIKEGPKILFQTYPSCLPIPPWRRLNQAFYLYYNYILFLTKIKKLDHFNNNVYYYSTTNIMPI